MARYAGWVLAALLMLPVYGRAADVCAQAPQQPQDSKAGPGDGHQRPPHWWIDPQRRQQLNITDAQSKSIEEIWQKSLPELRKLREQLMALQDQVSRMIDDGAPEAAVTAQIEQTENTRAQANKARTLMIYRMNKVLNADQRARVKAISPPLYDDHRDGRRGGSGR